MKISNKFGIPDQFAAYAQKKAYSRGRSNSSITTLIDSPQIAVLKEHHEKDITMDVSDMMWSIIGTAVHDVLARMDSSGTVEERLFYNIDGWIISGQPDVRYDEFNITINDHKMSSVWNVMHEKIDWERQLNGYAWLLYKVKGKIATKLQISCLVRDWRDADRFKPDYPPAPIVIIPQRLWTTEEQDRFFTERVRLHKEAQKNWFLMDELPECTTDEMWQKSSDWAVMGGEGKRAVRVFSTEAEAKKHANDKQWVVKRDGEYTRCDRFCEANTFCKQYLDRQKKKEQPV